ncbi:MAG: KamA family radical SAM protein [Bacteroidota bacterium]
MLRKIVKTDKMTSTGMIIHDDIEIISDEEPPSINPVLANYYTRLPETRKRTVSGHSRDTIKASSKSNNFRELHFPESTEDDWRDWRWQIKNSFTSLSTLLEFLDLSIEEINKSTANGDALPIRITPYYASLLDRNDSLQPLRKSVIPVLDEYTVNPGEASDPLCEEGDSPVPNLVHRYPDRALFLVTGFCSTYCRYCTRSHMVAKDKCHFGVKNLEPAFKYIEEHSEIRDVLLSGGDPLTLSDDDLLYILTRLKKIKHVEFIRIGTKVPAVLPQRITSTLINILKKFHPLWLSIHFTHPDEITPEVTEACARLADAGIPLGSQTVLLRGINDNVDTMKNLMHALLRIRVKPYYLYQCDPILGSEHFRTTIEKGLEIIRGLRGYTSGYAVPTYVIDAPGGGGKIPLLPEYYVGRDGNDVLLRNYTGDIFRYPDISY